MSLPAMPNPCTHAASAAWVRACEAAMPPAAVWTVDATAVQAFDSSALAALLVVQRLAHARGAALAVTGMPAAMQALVKMYGLQDAMPA